MKSSIRNQILWPFALIQTLTIGALSILLALRAIDAAQTQAVGRLNGVVQTLRDASFPVHSSILQQMKGLSAADYIALNDDGGIVGSTLPESTTARLVNQILGMKQFAKDDSSESGPSGTRQDSGISDFIPVHTVEGPYVVGRADIRKSSNASELFVMMPEGDWRALTESNMWPPLLIGAAALSIMVAVSIVLAGRFAQRIRRMQDHVRRISAGHFQLAIPESGSDELGELAESIHKLAGELDHLTQQIRINERAAVVTQVAGGLAHQLRNSITGARLAVQVHIRRCEQSDRESLQVALRQLSLTESQIRGLLTLTRDLQQKPEPGEADEVIRHVELLVQPECQHHQIRLDVQLSNSGFTISDAEQMEAALLNVVRNAMEATGPGGQVEIESSFAESRFIVEIRNTGPPVAPEIADNMFDPFVTSKPEGVGLGLTLASRAASDHHGQLTCLRTGEWTRFRFELPLSQA
ncbi:MAG: HAMP domain-containing histidine kinase [Planctomycetaceae bacterium]|nr:HAMP domain-containing histidine kinase [Planctomycetaceae bacterium]